MRESARRQLRKLPHEAGDGRLLVDGGARWAFAAEDERERGDVLAHAAAERDRAIARRRERAGGSAHLDRVRLAAEDRRANAAIAGLHLDDPAFLGILATANAAHRIDLAEHRRNVTRERGPLEGREVGRVQGHATV